MKQDKSKMEIVVTLSDKSVEDIANAVGHEVCNVMEMLLTSIVKDIREIKSSIEDVESNTRWPMFDNESDDEGVNIEQKIFLTRTSRF